MTSNLQNTYFTLWPNFSAPTKPETFPDLQLIAYNEELAKELWLDLEECNREERVQIFAWEKLLNWSEPAALAYAGHQFGYFTPQLGDWRALLLGEIIDTAGKRRDWQLKGSGRTVFSRWGDGKAPIGAVIREYIMSEALHHLWIPTTRALSMVSTWENVFRETVTIWWVLGRIASSHIRIGTFEYFAARGESENIKKLLDYSIERHYPECFESERPYEDFYRTVIENQCNLIIEWMRVGFIHGVMNTDNILISGETIDYGPCAFMDWYNLMQTYSSIDEQGRYAFGNQRDIILWNLERLWTALWNFISSEIQQKMISEAAFQLKRGYYIMMNAKIGLSGENRDDTLVDELFDYMQEGSVDYTQSFYYLWNSWEGYTEFRNLFMHCSDELWKKIDTWLEKYSYKLEKQGIERDEVNADMNIYNPVIIPRNHQVEKAIRAAVDQNNWRVFNKLAWALRDPYNKEHVNTDYFQPPKKHEEVLHTFCGT